MRHSTDPHGPRDRREAVFPDTSRDDHHSSVALRAVDSLGGVPLVAGEDTLRHRAGRGHASANFHTWD